MAARKRTEFTPKRKVDLLKSSDGKSGQQLAEMNGVGAIFFKIYEQTNIYITLATWRYLINSSMYM